MFLGHILGILTMFQGFHHDDTSYGVFDITLSLYIYI